MTLKQAVKRKKVAQVRKITKELPIADIADLLEGMTSEERHMYFQLLKSDLSSEIFSHLETEYQEQLVKLFDSELMKEVIGDMYASEIVDLIEELPGEYKEDILGAADEETKTQVKKLLKYEENQTGSIMNVDIVTFKQTLTIKESIELLKGAQKDVRFAHYYFVTDSKGKLVGYIAIEDLLFEKNSVKLSSIVKPTGYVVTTTDKEEAALQFANHDMSVFPVVDTSKKVVGMITSDEVIDVVTEEATEDIQRMAGIEQSHDLPYSKTGTLSIFKSRSLWLMLLMLSATISQIVLDSFQGFSNEMLAVALTTAIVAILPVISGAAGNAGSQSSTTIIRALSIGDITPRDYKKVLWKELKVSILLGLMLAIANFVRLVIYYTVKGEMDSEFVFLSLAASTALFIVIVLAKLSGGMLPLFAKKIKMDPAVMAAPLLTTLIDAMSTMIFFGISIGIMYMVI